MKAKVNKLIKDYFDAEKAIFKHVSFDDDYVDWNINIYGECEWRIINNEKIKIELITGFYTDVNGYVHVDSPCGDDYSIPDLIISKSRNNIRKIPIYRGKDLTLVIAYEKNPAKKLLAVFENCHEKK